MLVGTSHPGNIGSAARAMKTMGLSDLRLVRPDRFPDDTATAMASGARDLLETARVFPSLAEAVADRDFVVGTTARERHHQWPVADPRGAAEQLVGERRRGAVVFGRERTGLTNEEVDLCRSLVRIPADPAYSSLNLGAAVQVMTYELRMAALAPSERLPEASPEFPPATTEELEGFYGHLERVLNETGFLDPDNPRHLMRRLRRLFDKAQPDRNEVNILRGILKSVQRPRRRGDSGV